MMVCTRCGLSVHNCCYGLKTEYEIEETFFNEKIGRFSCDKCKIKPNEINVFVINLKI